MQVFIIPTLFTPSSRAFSDPTKLPDDSYRFLDRLIWVLLATLMQLFFHLKLLAQKLIDEILKLCPMLYIGPGTKANETTTTITTEMLAELVCRS